MSDKNDHISAFLYENENEMVYNKAFSNFVIISNQILSLLTKGFLVFSLIFA